MDRVNHVGNGVFEMRKTKDIDRLLIAIKTFCHTTCGFSRTANKEAFLVKYCKKCPLFPHTEIVLLESGTPPGKPEDQFY
jgi:hypothetical protein